MLIMLVSVQVVSAMTTKAYVDLVPKNGAVGEMSWSELSLQVGVGLTRAYVPWLVLLHQASCLGRLTLVRRARAIMPLKSHMCSLSLGKISLLAAACQGTENVQEDLMAN